VVGYCGCAEKSRLSAIDPIANIAHFASNVEMTKLFYGSYVVSALLGLLHVFLFVEADLRGELRMYHPVFILTSGATSMLLLASIFFPLRPKIFAILLFAGCTITAYVRWISRWPINPTSMSLFDGFLHGSFFLIFAFVPAIGVVSGTLLLRRHPDHKTHSEEESC
jgi:asparagine N-glycosylation enzyme membrane subunit Stt3